MRRVSFLGAIVLFTFFGATAANGSVITVNAKTLDSLLGSGATPVGSVMITPMTEGTMSANVYSQAYTNANGDYAYLYQIDNVGGASSLVEQFTLAPFTGADDAVDLGYLNGTLPTGFVTGTARPPESTAFVDAAAGPVVSFYFNGRYGAKIASGQHSEILYVRSQLTPDQINGNVIDGSTATGHVIGPVVPEPATLGLLSIAGLALLRRRVPRQ